MPWPCSPASCTNEISIVSSSGVTIGKPSRRSTCMSNLAFCSTFSTQGSVSSGDSTSIASASVTCSASTV